MKPLENWEEVNEGREVRDLQPGIYLLKITDVKDVPEKEYLEIYFDIAKGEFKDYFGLAKANMGRDISKEIRSYKETALPFFKRFITAVEKSNPEYHWDWDETKLVGKFVIGVFGEEEYVKDNDIKISCKLQEFRSIPSYKEGKIKVPEIKRLPEDMRPTDYSKVFKTKNVDLLDLSDDDLPF